MLNTIFDFKTEILGIANVYAVKCWRQSFNVDHGERLLQHQP